MSRVLIVEDDALIAAFVEQGLVASGFSVERSVDGHGVPRRCATEQIDLVLLDMALPDREGYEILRELRGQGHTVPVIVLIGRPDLRDAVECLEVGADDYMEKPFRFDELLARIRVRLRERNAPSTSTVLQAGGLTLDLLSRRVDVGDRTVELTAREFTLLETFMRHPHQVLTRQQLLSSSWGYEFDPGTNIINVYVSTLRQKIGPERIETVRGMGYRLRTVRPSDPPVPLPAR